MAFELTYSLCFLLILLHLPLFTTSQPYQNKSLGSSLVAQDDDSAWLSPSEEFAFGFQRIGNDGGFLLAIWFNKIPGKTVVWSAINGSLFQKGSTVEFTVDGFFIKDSETGNQQFISDQTAANGVAYAAMLDTGNFVLANKNSINLWESFHYPTNTILPTQTLSQGNVLYASYSETNYSKGRFQLNLQFDGNLVLYTTNFPLDTPNYAYWFTKTEGSGFQVVFNMSGYILLTDKNGSVVYTVSDSDKMASVKDYYQRATLDSDGVFRHYVYHKSNGSFVETGTKAWSTFWFQPPNICIAIEDRGPGPCGFNSICEHDDQGPTICRCPQGYTSIDVNDERKGCKQKFIPQSCDESSPESHGFVLAEMPYTDWPNGDYEHFQPVDEDWCKKSCLGDCFCAIAIYNNDRQDCYKKGIPLLNGRNDNSTAWKSLIKVGADNSTSKYGKKKEISALVLVGSALMLIISYLIIFIITYLFFSRLYSKQAKTSDLYPVVQGFNLKRFTYMELKEATEGFKEELGRGGFATVYKGVLASDNGKGVAVKRLDNMVRENDFEFKAEVSMIGGTSHKNLVKLLGFCNEGQHRILVYEFMTNGSLSSFLFGNSRPSWYQRREIALGTARGLRYLHEECSSQIIHCDIKPQNILLDDSFTARIADFGVAKLLKMDQTRTTTRFRGTKGYVAPEWFKSLPVTVKADVYSFGILLLEIICCRKHYEENVQDEEQMILADWAYGCYEQKKLHLLIKNDDDEAKQDIKNMELFLMIAFWCIQEDPSLRPTMSKVTPMLEGNLEVSVPPNPSSLYVLSK
ncbi:G-type lectin S-receptor-like serine/threonine-protein kinase LECRK2 [Pyrus communis]|uniref:G-type lectin S-receptor-like serine/threonine-protein kinase LECRK2 n=1 Tax=Pyrus communis TaxID=23211 RepID=UPI0035C23DAE